MNPQSRLAALQKFRMPPTAHGHGGHARGKVLVVFELTVKTNESGPVRVVINYDLPRSVEGYAQRSVEETLCFFVVLVIFSLCFTKKEHNHTPNYLRIPFCLSMIPF